MTWFRRRFKVVPVTGIGDAPNGWAITDNGEIAAFLKERQEAKYAAKRANMRGFL